MKSSASKTTSNGKIPSSQSSHSPGRRDPKSTSSSPTKSATTKSLVPGSWHAGEVLRKRSSSRTKSPVSSPRRSSAHEQQQPKSRSPSNRSVRRTPHRTQSSPTSSKLSTPSSLRRQGRQHQEQKQHNSTSTDVANTLPMDLPLVDSTTGTCSSNHRHRSASSAPSITTAATTTASILQQLPSHSNSSSKTTRHRGNITTINNNSGSINNKSMTSFNGQMSSSISSFAWGQESSSGSIAFGSSLNSSSEYNASASSSSVIPSLYRCARKGYWDEVGSSLLDEASMEELSFQYKKDGTTVLHLAIMSRTGYINSFRTGNSSKTGALRRTKSADNSSSTIESTLTATTATTTTTNSSAMETGPGVPDDEPGTAPLWVIEELLRVAPQVAEIRCNLNGYTPLTYACLVCNENYDTEDGAAMVRLFLKYCPSSIKVFSREGLSPVDIHIVSYSHHHKDKEDESARGRTSTSVLRALLQHSPDLANLRRQGDKVEGPIELLYKCNSSAFSKAVMDEVYDSDDDGTVRSDYTIPERRQQVVDTVTKWWIWTWAVMILKYGSLTKNKKKGSRFAAVHTACMQVGVPTPILSITLYAFPRQIKQTIETADESGNLPLHAVCSWPCYLGQHRTGDGDPIVPIRKTMAINRVLDEYPLAIKAKNKRGESPLELALTSGTTWDGGVRRIAKANPKALKLQSPITRLYPFMTAATALASKNEAENGADLGEEYVLPTKRQDLNSLRTIYGLLRANPKVLSQAYQINCIER
jgi:hypothetical protein